jgi:chemotaxis protein CheX
MSTTYDNYIEQVVQSIFSTMLGMEVARDDAAEPTFDEKLLATIQIAGAKSLSVVLSVSPGVARASVAAMLQVPLDGVSDVDERDVVAELANMIGGNLKSLLPPPLYLSLPTVVEGKDLGVQVPGAELVEDVLLQCESGPLRVRLYSQLGGA